MIVAEVANALLAGWDQFAPEGGTDLEEIEQRVQRLLRLGGGVMVEHVAEGAVGNLPRPVCAGCGKQMEVACRRAREPEGLAGRYRLQRTVYVCRHGDRTAVPADEFWGLGPGTLSPALRLNGGPGGGGSGGEGLLALRPVQQQRAEAGAD